MDLKRDNDSNIIITGNFNNSLLHFDRSTKVQQENACCFEETDRREELNIDR